MRKIIKNEDQGGSMKKILFVVFTVSFAMFSTKAFAGSYAGVAITQSADINGIHQDGGGSSG